ncbi:hypothetical protein ACHWQZ_G014741 [Mnemiopsis leidyi]
MATLPEIMETLGDAQKQIIQNEIDRLSIRHREEKEAHDKLKTEAAEIHLATETIKDAHEREIHDLRLNQQQQLLNVKEKLQKQSEEAVANARDQAVTEYKKTVTRSEKSVKRPESYTPDKDIRIYMSSWDYYKSIIGLSESTAIYCFFTYLDIQSHQKLKALNIHQETSWDRFKTKVINALDRPKSKIAMKHKLRNLKQSQTETLTEFYGRLLQTASEAFEEEEIQEKELALKESLAAGILNDSVAVEIIEHEDWDFKKSMDFALKKESSISARKEMSVNPEGQEVTILKVDGNISKSRKDTSHEIRSVNAPSERDNKVNNSSYRRSPPSSPFKRCYNCNKQGHLAASCKERKVCYYCGKAGHIKKACFNLQRNKAYNNRMSSNYNGNSRPMPPAGTMPMNFPPRVTRPWTNNSGPSQVNFSGPSDSYNPTQMSSIPKN